MLERANPIPSLSITALFFTFVGTLHSYSTAERGAERDGKFLLPSGCFTWDNNELGAVFHTQPISVTGCDLKPTLQTDFLLEKIRGTGLGKPRTAPFSSVHVPVL